MEIPDVSVIVPTCRREHLVICAIQSALAQERVRTEVIVLDDADEASARGPVADLSDPRVSYVKRARPSRGRPAFARNEGIQLARGRFLHFLDDDDVLAPEALVHLMRPLEFNPSVGMSFGLVDAFGDDPAILARERNYYVKAATTARRCNGSRSKLAREVLFGTAPFITSACLIRATAALDVGGFDTSLAVAEEYEFFLRVIRTHGAVFVDRPVLCHRTGLPSLSSGVPPNEWSKAYKSMHEMYRERFGTLEFFGLQAWARLSKATS